MSRTKQPLGAYIHIPFCARKCAYCDFLSAPASTETMERYVERLKEEIRAAAEGLRENYQAATVFFGGGTPSILSGRLLCGVLEELYRQLPVEAGAEITVECNPGTLTEEKLSAYRAAGVNRLSIGLQSADNRELKALGRIHTYEEFLESFELARRKGFRNLNVDLMSALPGQTREGWLSTLSRVAELGPEHISAYSLIIEEGTPFYEKYREGTPGHALLPNEDEDRLMYEDTKEFLREKGYEIGNIDATVIAQKPKLAPFIEAMRKETARVLQIDPDRLNIKATTEERLGFSGREEGIAAHAVCLLE